MGKLKQRILDTIAWIALIIGIIMVLWRVFGNSLTDIQVVSPFIVFGLTKIWSNNNKIMGVGHQIEIFKHEVRNSFDKVKEEIKGGKK